MSNGTSGELTRRAVLVAGVTGAAAIAASGRGASAGGPEPKQASAPASRMPVVYVPHGGGPWPFVDVGIGDRSEQAALAGYLRTLKDVPQTPPKALVVISAHWEEAVATVMSGTRPPMLYDYSGFPPESYVITWPAPGHPAVAARVRALLDAAGILNGADAERGFDHGTFVPLKLAYPEADVPTVQLSLKRGLDPAEHLAIGRALAPLRDEGIFIVASGSSFHNLRGFGDPRARPVSQAFDTWLRESVVLARDDRDRRLVEWASAPSARQAHPREEHLLPLMVVAGAAGESAGRVAYSGTLTGLQMSGYQFG